MYAVQCTYLCTVLYTKKSTVKIQNSVADFRCSIHTCSLHRSPPTASVLFYYLVCAVMSRVPYANFCCESYAIVMWNTNVPRGKNFLRSLDYCHGFSL
jgi:hypothetical protein